MDSTVHTTAAALAVALAVPGVVHPADARAQAFCDTDCAAHARPAQAGSAFDQAFGPSPEPGSLPAIPVITISRDGDPVGKPAYAARSTFSGTAAVVEFSSRPVRSALSAPARGASRSLPGGGATSGFGMRQHPILGGTRLHAGVDLAAASGAPILAGTDGVVSAAGWRGGYGLCVSVEHGGGLQTRYAHLSRLNVVAGQRIARGQVIGFVGSTGLSTGPHLHYELRLNGAAMNPLPKAPR